MQLEKNEANQQLNEEIHSLAIYDVAIVGAGPVGMFSVFAFGMQKLNCLLIDSLDKIGGQCSSLYPEKAIYDIPAYAKVNGQELIDNINAQIKPFKPKVQLNSFVKNIIEHDEHFELDILQHGLNQSVKARCVVLALGSGVFMPMKLDIVHTEQFEDKNIFYFLGNISKFKDKNVAIIGAGDSAIDWALTLSDVAKKVFLIHRRDYIKAHPASWDKVQACLNIEIKIPFMIESLLIDEGDFQGISIKSLENDLEEQIYADFLLPCFGLKSNMAFLSQWNLQLHNNLVMTDPTTMRTSKKGIYSIGDCVYYNNKRKLIATGFAEAFQCAKDIFNYLNPDKAAPIGHSTSLGVPKV